MPNPYKARQWARGTQGRAKTDRLDARALARYGKSESLPDWKPLPERLKQLDELLKRQDSLKEALNQENNRLHALESQGVTSGAAVESIRRSISWLEEELKRLSGDVDCFLHEHPDLKEQADKLRTVSGVGSRNSLFLLVLLHRWSLLTDGQGEHKGLVAYAGLDPVPFDSGKSIHRPRKISRQGNPKIRANLYMGAMASLRGDNPLKAFYRRLLGNNKKKKVALVAAARKILVWAWGVFREKTIFDPKLAVPRTK